MRYIYIIITVLITCLLLQNNILCAQAQESEILFAKKAIDDGFYDLAVEKLQVFLGKYPDSLHKSEAHLLLGKCFYNKGEFKKALYEFELITKDPEAGELEDDALYWTAEVYFKSGQYDKAMDYYQRIIDDFQDSPFLSFSYYSIGWCYYELKEYAEALDELETVISRFPLISIVVKAEYKICEILYEAKEFAKARLRIYNFLKAHPLNESRADLYYMLADSSFYLGDFKDAIRNFDEALSMAAEDAQWRNLAIYRKGRAYFKLENYQEALDAFTECSEKAKEPNVISAGIFGMAQSYEKLDNLNEAEKYYLEIIENFGEGEWADDAFYWV